MDHQTAYQIIVGSSILLMFCGVMLLALFGVHHPTKWYHSVFAFTGCIALAFGLLLFTACFCPIVFYYFGY
jgi:hypothetical protein